ncbi:MULTISPECIES: hypothetical protein [Hyphobacterium]|uniref:DUF4760 domain-containing protein n=1 Tax=Hyphobacterium vulgare TaxID=1736751 RepID=A0ABV6ZUB5_9PROT
MFESHILICVISCAGISMDAPDWASLAPLFGLLKRVPTPVEVVSMPLDVAGIVVAVISILIAVVAAFGGAFFGAKVSAQHSKEIALETQDRQHRAVCRYRFYRLVDECLDAVNYLGQLKTYIDQETKGCTRDDVVRGAWKAIPVMAWKPSVPHRLSQEAALLLYEYREHEALQECKDIISLTASLAGNYDRFERTKERFTDEADAIPRAPSLSDENIGTRSFHIDAAKYPKAHRLAVTAGMMVPEILKRLDRFDEFKNAVETLLVSLSERHVDDWGLGAPFPGFSLTQESEMKGPFSAPSAS